MSTDDPYVAPRAALPCEPADRRLRGMLWFAVPMLALMFLYADTLEQAGEMAVEMVLPAAFAGHFLQRWCRTFSWLRYLAFALLVAIAWAVGFLIVYGSFWSALTPGEAPGTLATIAIFTIPVTLFLATTLRVYDRLRP